VVLIAHGLMGFLVLGSKSNDIAPRFVCRLSEGVTNGFWSLEFKVNYRLPRRLLLLNGAHGPDILW